jgi:hypothetical protein
MIIPGEKELTNPQRLIRRMPEQGDLQSTHNYLDILFRLLHDDAIHDLRNGVTFMRLNANTYKTRRELKQKLKEYTAVKLYDKISI